MSGKITNSNLIKSIELTNLLSWIFDTTRADLSRYKQKKRPISIQRLWRMLVPNLQRPIFIIGSGRSGTTFLGDCIAEIPEISYHFEPVVIKAAARYVYEGQWKFENAQRFYRTVYAWLMRLHFDADLRFAEKQPRNSLIISFLYQAFPNAQFVHIIRDGRDVTVSLLQKPWFRADSRGTGLKENGGYPMGNYPWFWVEPGREQEFEATSDTHRCAWVWHRYVENILRIAPDLPESQYYELKYENLVCNSTDEANNLLDFLEIFDHNSRYLFRQAIATIKPDSVGRWKRDLSEYQLQQIYAEAGGLLSKLGYLN